MRMNDLGLLALRVGVGGTMAAHGAQKLRSREGAAATFQALGFPRHEQAALAAAGTEIAGGALLATGLATPAAAAAVIGSMRTAVDVHKDNGFFAQSGGFELPAAYGLVAGALAFTGPGRLSLDHLLRDRLAKPWMAIVGLAAGFAGGTLMARARRAELARREAAAPQQQVIDLTTDTTAAERADDEVMMGIQTPF